MPTINKTDAIEKLALAVEGSSSEDLIEFYNELFPAKKIRAVSGAVASQLAQHIRAGLEYEEIVDLWRVVFPADRYVHYDDEENVVRYNEGAPWYVHRQFS